MTDRAKALVVHLDDDYRIGDVDSGADRLTDAIAMLRGVTKVESLVTTTADHFARERARQELRDDLFAVLNRTTNTKEPR